MPPPPPCNNAPPDDKNNPSNKNSHGNSTGIIPRKRPRRPPSPNVPEIAPPTASPRLAAAHQIEATNFGPALVQECPLAKLPCVIMAAVLSFTGGSGRCRERILSDVLAVRNTCRAFRFGMPSTAEGAAAASSEDGTAQIHFTGAINIDRPTATRLVLEQFMLHGITPLGRDFGQNSVEETTDRPVWGNLGAFSFDDEDRGSDDGGGDACWSEEYWRVVESWLDLACTLRERPSLEAALNIVRVTLLSVPSEGVSVVFSDRFGMMALPLVNVLDQPLDDAFEDSSNEDDIPPTALTPVKPMFTSIFRHPMSCIESNGEACNLCISSWKKFNNCSAPVHATNKLRTLKIGDHDDEAYGSNKFVHVVDEDNMKYSDGKNIPSDDDAHKIKRIRGGNGTDDEEKCRLSSDDDAASATDDRANTTNHTEASIVIVNTSSHAGNEHDSMTIEDLLEAEGMGNASDQSLNGCDNGAPDKLNEPGDVVKNLNRSSNVVCKEDGDNDIKEGNMNCSDESDEGLNPETDIKQIDDSVDKNLEEISLNVICKDDDRDDDIQGENMQWSGESDDEGLNPDTDDGNEDGLKTDDSVDKNLEEISSNDNGDDDMQKENIQWSGESDNGVNPETDDDDEIHVPPSSKEVDKSLDNSFNENSNGICKDDSGDNNVEEENVQWSDGSDEGVNPETDDDDEIHMPHRISRKEVDMSLDNSSNVICKDDNGNNDAEEENVQWSNGSDEGVNPETNDDDEIHEPHKISSEEVDQSLDQKKEITVAENDIRNDKTNEGSNLRSKDLVKTCEGNSNEEEKLQWSEGSDEGVFAETDEDESNADEIGPDYETVSVHPDGDSNDLPESQNSLSSQDSEDYSIESVESEVSSDDDQADDFIGVPVSSRAHPNNQIPASYRKHYGNSIGQASDEYVIDKFRFQKVNLASFHDSHLTPLVRNLPHGLTCPICSGYVNTFNSSSKSDSPGITDIEVLPSLLLDVVAYKSSAYARGPPHILLTHTPLPDNWSENEEASSDGYGAPFNNPAIISAARARYESVPWNAWGGAGRFLPDAKNAISVRCTVPDCPFEVWAPASRCMGANGVDCNVKLPESARDGGRGVSNRVAARLRREGAPVPPSLGAIATSSDLGAAVPRDTYVRRRCSSAGCQKSVRCMSCSNRISRYTYGMRSNTALSRTESCLYCGLCRRRHCIDCRSTMPMELASDKQIYYTCCGPKAKKNRHKRNEDGSRVEFEYDSSSLDCDDDDDDEAEIDAVDEAEGDDLDDMEETGEMDDENDFDVHGDVDRSDHDGDNQFEDNAAGGNGIDGSAESDGGEEMYGYNGFSGPDDDGEDESEPNRSDSGEEAVDEPEGMDEMNEVDEMDEDDIDDADGPDSDGEDEFEWDE